MRPAAKLVPTACLTFCAILLLCLASPIAVAQKLPSIEEKTRGLDRHEGFFNVYWDAHEGKVLLEVPRMEVDFLYMESLARGLGSNDVGLDRGQLGDRWIVRFERYGRKVLLVAPNIDYRADGAGPAEARSVQEAFAEGVVFGFSVVAESGTRVLIDATDFVVRDAHGVVQRLKATGQGTFSPDAGRSAPVARALKSFPRNTELEARLTFTSDEPGNFVRDVAAVPSSFSVRVRHSLIELPEPGFVPRAFHPRSGFFGPEYSNYSAPIGEDMSVRLIARHRLEKKDPSAAVSDAVEPIVYYLDPGTPEPVRSALLEGARWWGEAFEAAGFRNAYRVEMLPEDADPLDVRYNVIQWVHRATRGWSYGDAVTDPRTGEIIKGHVSLGSLRVRQDYLLAEGLLAPYGNGSEQGPPTGNDPMLAMALARIRQLSAHEIGHTIGLAHNFAASVSSRSSVMDYPAPLARLNDAGDVVLTDAYAAGVGEWDKLAVRYGYGVPPPGQTEKEFLEEVLAEARAKEIEFVTDVDARPPGAVHPDANLWDNGEDMIASLENEMVVRSVALHRFGENVIRAGRPLATMEEVLVPLYLRHRYQIEATVKLLGGMRYGYFERGEGLGSPTTVAGDVQRAALSAMLAALQPAELRLPESVLREIPPRPYGWPHNRELFLGNTGLSFDPYAPAEALATHLISLLVNAERASRLVYQNDFDATMPSLDEVFRTLISTVFSEPVPGDAYDAELQRTVQRVVVDVLEDLAADPETARSVTARTEGALRELRDWLSQRPDADRETAQHRTAVLGQINRFLSRDRSEVTRGQATEMPPGSPIGAGLDDVRKRLDRSRQLFVALRSRADECAWGWRASE